MVLVFGLTVHEVPRLSGSEADRTAQKSVGHVLPKYLDFKSQSNLNSKRVLIPFKSDRCSLLRGAWERKKATEKLKEGGRNGYSRRSGFRVSVFGFRV